MENSINSKNKTNNKKSKISRLITPILASTLFFTSPNGTIAQNTSNQTRNKAEVVTSTILDRLDQKLGVSLPNEYKNKVLDFVLNDTIMRTRSATVYTEEFIINEMQKDRGISKQDQLLFIWSKIYGGISQKKLYNRLDDENENRSAEYKKSLKQIATCYEGYKKGFKTYMETKSAEARQQSAEARQQSIEATNEGLKQITRYYNLCKNNPTAINNEELKETKKYAKHVIQNCKKYNIDYKSKLSSEILKFYGVE